MNQVAIPRLSVTMVLIMTMTVPQTATTLIVPTIQHARPEVPVTTMVSVIRAKTATVVRMTVRALPVAGPPTASAVVMVYRKGRKVMAQCVMVTTRML